MSTDLLPTSAGKKTPLWEAAVSALWTAGAAFPCGDSLGSARGDDPVCALLTPPPLPEEDGEEGELESDDEPPCGLLERQLARQLAGLKQEPVEIDEDGENEMGKCPWEAEFGIGDGVYDEEGGEETGFRDGDADVRDGDGEIRDGDGESHDGEADVHDGEADLRDEKEDVHDGKVGVRDLKRGVCEGNDVRDGKVEVRDEADVRDGETEFSDKKDLSDKDAKAEVKPGEAAQTDAETNGTSAGPTKAFIEKEPKNGIVREQNGVLDRELHSLSERRNVDGGSPSQTPAQKADYVSSESTKVSPSNASDESSQVKNTPAGETLRDVVTGDTSVRDTLAADTPPEADAVAREARSERRSPPRKRRRSLSSGSRGGGSSSPGDRSGGRSPSSTFRSGADAESAESDSESESLACDLCPRRLRSVSQLRRHRLYRHGEWRGPLRCPRCPRRFFLAAHRRLHVCAGDDAGRRRAALLRPLRRRAGRRPPRLPGLGRRSPTAPHRLRAL